MMSSRSRRVQFQPGPIHRVWLCRPQLCPTSWGSNPGQSRSKWRLLIPSMNHLASPPFPLTCLQVDATTWVSTFHQSTFSHLWARCPSRWPMFRTGVCSRRNGTKITRRNHLTSNTGIVQTHRDLCLTNSSLTLKTTRMLALILRTCTWNRALLICRQKWPPWKDWLLNSKGLLLSPRKALLTLTHYEKDVSETKFPLFAQRLFSTVFATALCGCYGVKELHFIEKNGVCALTVVVWRVFLMTPFVAQKLGYR